MQVEKGAILIVNEVDLHPHKIRYWLHSSEKTESPESFADKVNEICSLYQSAQKQSRKGTHIVSTDEMTGVQALEHKYPDKLHYPVSAPKWSLSTSATGRPASSGSLILQLAVWKCRI